MRIASREVMLTVAACVVGSASVSVLVASPTNADEAAPAIEQSWVSAAERVIGELEDLLKDKAKWETPGWEHLWDRDLAHRRTERILWRLWKATGKPPLLREPDESLAASIQRNASAYREYVAAHANLTAEELHRQGMKNAVESFGSPLWYMTIRYLEEKAGVETRYKILIFTTPNRLLVLRPLDSPAYQKMSGAFADWLSANDERMVWNPESQKFEPTEGGYAGTGDLFLTIMEASSPESAELVHEVRERLNAERQESAMGVSDTQPSARDALRPPESTEP